MLTTTKVSRVETEQDRALALAVLRSTYELEKQWVVHAEDQFPAADLDTTRVSWFVVTQGSHPAGVLRVHYEPPITQYHAYDIKLLRPGLDVQGFLADNRIAEIGRFAVIPGQRHNLLLAVALMRAATRETVERGYTHFITDVFEGDPHSPYRFHTRVMGFLPVATHEHGELASRCRRITMILDLKAAYQRLRQGRSWIFRALTADWDDGLHRRLA
jgi:hypothetical protein